MVRFRLALVSLILSLALVLGLKMSVQAAEYTDNDLWVLAHVLAGECHSVTDDDDQLKVGSVFLNRVKSPEYPNDFLGVVSDKKYGIQYMCYWDGNYYKEPTDRNIANARWLLENGPILPEYIVFQTGHKGRIPHEYSAARTKWHKYGW